MIKASLPLLFQGIWVTFSYPPPKPKAPTQFIILRVLQGFEVVPSFTRKKLIFLLLVDQRRKTKNKNSSIICSNLLFVSFPKASFRSKPQAIPNARSWFPSKYLCGHFDKSFRVSSYSKRPLAEISNLYSIQILWSWYLMRWSASIVWRIFGISLWGNSCTISDNKRILLCLFSSQLLYCFPRTGVFPVSCFRIRPLTSLSDPWNLLCLPSDLIFVFFAVRWVAP